MSTSRSFRHTVVALALQAVFFGNAGATTITREFTAAWYDPSRSGHGLGLEVIESNGVKSALAYWFTYDKQGRQMWLFGTGPIVEDRVSITAYLTSGGAFDNGFDPAQVRAVPWGTIELSFDDCNTGRLSYAPVDPAQPPGSMPLKRMTSLYNSACSGGVSDDRRPNSAEQELIEFLANRGRYPVASAKAKFGERADRTEFSVELEDLPAGDYALRVDGASRGTIKVVTTARGSEGELEFRSPSEPGKILLDFDPRGAVIEILDSSGVLFDGLFDGSNQGGGTPPSQPPSVGPPRGNAAYELVVEPAGNDGPELHAKMKQLSDRVEFSVELEDLAPASYLLRVGGTERGSIAVVRVEGGTEGELEFRDPVETGKVLLDFDPRGEVISIERDGATVISGTFPTNPTGPVSGGGGSDDGDDDDDDDDNGGGGGGGGGGNGGGGSPTIGVWTTGLASTGADGNANGEASYEVTSNEREFEVEIEDLADGSYELSVGGVARARISVSDEKGEVKINSPARAGRLMLDFDPRGALIEVSRNGTVYLRGTLD